MTFERLLLALCLAATAACDVTALDQREQPIAVNSCNSDDDCRTVGRCVDNRCLAKSGKFSTLLFEVEPIANGIDFTPPQVFLVKTDVPPAGGSYSLVLPDSSQLKAAISAKEALPATCTLKFLASDGTTTLLPADDGTIPARLTFTPAEQRWGTTGETRTVSAAEASGARASYTVQTKLGAGNYDVYVEPFAQLPSAGCVLPPFLLRGQHFDPGKVEFSASLPEPAHLLVDVRWPKQQGSLLLWTIDMVDPLRGRVISTRETKLLAADDPNPIYQHYRVALDYYPVTGADAEAPGGELVRLTPPDGVVAPTLLFERAALELLTPGTASITQFDELPTPVKLRGTAFNAASGEPIAASVSLLATELLGLEGLPVVFRRDVITDASGAFSVDVLPGHYQVRTAPQLVAGPTEVPLVAVTSELQMATAPEEQGHSFPLSTALAVSGSVFVQGESAAARGAAISADPAVSNQSDSGSQLPRLSFYLRSRTILSPPRAAAAAVDDDGNFNLFVEAGKFDLSVRSPVASGFGWLVVPSLDLTHARAFDRLTLQFPVQLDLQVSLDGKGDPTTLVGAQVQAFALLDGSGVLTSEPNSARSALLIAQASLDVNGFTELLLPPTLNSNIQ